MTLTDLEELSAEVKDVGAHEILSLNSAKNDDVAPNTLITENTNTAVSIKTRKRLRDLLGLAYILPS
jgi:hypothetical protein